MKLRYTRPALTDLVSILSEIAENSPRGAQRVQNRIQTILDLLQAYPAMGAITDDRSIRRMPVTPYPYLIFYEIGDEHVIIHAIRHGARDPSGQPGAF